VSEINKIQIIIPKTRLFVCYDQINFINEQIKHSISTVDQILYELIVNMNNYNDKGATTPINMLGKLQSIKKETKKSVHR